jgi:ABC-type transporter Mla subunit MlaD
MSTEERVLRLENAFATLEELATKSDERTSDLEKHFKMLPQLAVSASERPDTHESWINSLGTRMEELAESHKELAEAQRQSEAHLSVLAQIVRDLGHAQARTEKALERLTERFEQYISSRP